MTKQKKLRMLVILISATIFLFIFWNSTPSQTERRKLQKIQKILRNARLADLPESTNDVRISGWNSFFTGESYLMFHAAPNDIEKFIALSSSLRDVKPKIFNSEHMFLPRPAEINTETPLNHEYFLLNRNWPPWYNITIKMKGKRYEIPGDPIKKGHNWGSVVVNEETNTVYIHVIWS